MRSDFFEKTKLVDIASIGGTMPYRPAHVHLDDYARDAHFLRGQGFVNSQFHNVLLGVRGLEKVFRPDVRASIFYRQEVPNGGIRRGSCELLYRDTKAEGGREHEECSKCASRADLASLRKSGNIACRESTSHFFDLHFYKTRMLLCFVRNVDSEP